MNDNISILLDEIKDNIFNNYGKFIRTINREFKKIVNNYELSSKQIEELNDRLKLVINKIKTQVTDNKIIAINEIDTIINEYLEKDKEITEFINFDFKGYWRGNWHIAHEDSFGWENGLLVNDLEQGRVLKVLHKSASSCAKITPHNIGGLQFFNNFRDKYNNLSLEYSVKFQDGFRFCRGGRLPGLYGGEIISETQVPNGTNGFLSKLGWTSNGFGELILNLPPVNGQNSWYYTGGNWRFTPGKWHTIKQELYLNNKDDKNGYARITFDGKEVILINDLYFRASNDIKIKGFAFTNYYGESDPLATCPADTFIEFSYFKIF